MSLKKTE
jgi:hypothetical protein